MTLNHPPQTFEEWWANPRNLPSGLDVSKAVLLKAAWDAALASQQAEIERLRRFVGDPMLLLSKSNHADYVARYEAVVEAAREVHRNYGIHPTSGDAVSRIDRMERLGAALGALEDGR